MPPHMFIGERCVHCNINIYDWDDESPCVDYPGRKTAWSFGPEKRDEVPG